MENYFNITIIEDISSFGVRVTNKCIQDAGLVFLSYGYDLRSIKTKQKYNSIINKVDNLFLEELFLSG